MKQDDVKNDFPLFQNEPNLVYLDSAATAQKPQVVLDAMNAFYTRDNANIHRGVYQLSQRATHAYEIARSKVAKLINANTNEMIFVRSTTEAINLVASSFGQEYVHEGDEILISGMEHHANLVPWQLLAASKKARLCVIPIQDDGSISLEDVKRSLSDKTKLLAITHVSNTLGTINPVKDIIRLAHEKGIPVLIDGAQAVPHMRVDIKDLDADFYAFSGHKMYGPTGIGALYMKEQWMETLPPYQSGGDMIESVTFESTTFAKGPQKFEAGTPAIAGAIGLGAAADYLMRLGLNNIASHEQALTAYAKQELSNIPGLRFIGNAPKQAGIISFVIEGIHPHDIGTILDQHQIAIRTGHHCTQPLMERFNVPATSRFSFGVYNMMEDIDKAVDALKEAIKLLG